MEPSQIRSLLQRWPHSSVTPPFIWLFGIPHMPTRSKLPETPDRGPQPRRRRSGMRSRSAKIPNFVGADAATERLAATTPERKRATTIMCDPGLVTAPGRHPDQSESASRGDQAVPRALLDHGDHGHLRTPLPLRAGVVGGGLDDASLDLRRTNDGQKTDKRRLF